MSDISIKKQVVEKIKESSNILITVNSNPSVDELSAALGLTLFINKFDKHATAVFSGDVPSAIDFLEPGKTFENTVDSLRDFIIALDKEKADHLRYKVEGDVVKIFITPYQTVINENDLEFSQGDYNVELVLALGVENSDDLDQALESHGRILHDASVVTLSIGSEASNLGDITYHVDQASSYCEVIASLAEEFKQNGKSQIDEQIATALLTGIVGATNRFSNEKTSSKVMSIAAQLMSSGANQQLIAAQLDLSEEKSEEATEEATSEQIQKTSVEESRSEPETPAKSYDDGSHDLNEGSLKKLKKTEESGPEEPKPVKKPADGTLAVEHHKEEKEPVDESSEQSNQTERQEESQSESDDAAKIAEQKLAEQLAQTPQINPIEPLATVNDSQGQIGEVKSENVITNAAEAEPMMGGTLNATTEQAAEEKRRENQASMNHTILSHGGHTQQHMDEKPLFADAPFTSSGKESDEQPSVDIFSFQETPQQPSPALSQPQPQEPEAVKMEAPAPAQEPNQALAPVENVVPATMPAPIDIQTPSGPTLAELDAKNRGHDNNFSGNNMPMPPESPLAMPPLPDFSTLPPLPGEQPAQYSNDQSVDKLGDILNTPEPSIAQPTPNPFQDPNLFPPIGPAPSAPSSDDANKMQDQPQSQPQTNDPKQFRIPGQG